jgi:hypothetical protein
MANPFGSGTAMVIPLPARKDAQGIDPSSGIGVDEASTVRVREPKATQQPAPESPEVTQLVARILEALGASREDGLTAVELREQLGVRPDHLQRALAAGLRARKFRRSGSRCRLRYVLNA